MEIEPIGIIHTPFKTKEECPVQPRFANSQTGKIELFEQFALGLKDIETFSHIYLIYQFDRSGAVEMIRSTFLDDIPRGLFATRHPCRPSQIGISIVELVKKDGCFLEVKGVDMLDKTPLLDIKPYIPKYDRIDEASEGWTENVVWRPKPEGRE